MSVILKIVMFSVLAAQVRVNRLDGSGAEGELQSISAAAVQVQTADSEIVSVPLEEVLQVAWKTVGPNADSENTPARPVTQLVDGSRMHTSQSLADAETVTVTADHLGEVKLPRAVVRSILLQPVKHEWVAQWGTFLKRTNNKDMLIVEKRDGEGLDFLSGLVSAIENEQISFLLDGDDIAVPRQRVTGIIFATAAKADSALSGEISVRLSEDTSIRARSVTSDSGMALMESSWGQKLSMPLELFSEIDFSSSRLHYLSDLQPLTEQYFGMEPPGREWGPLFDEDLSTRTGLSSQWRMSRDCFANNGRPPLTLRGQTYRKGLCLFPSAKVEYAIDSRYSQLTAMVGVDDDVAFNQQKGLPPTAVELRIEGDGRELFKRLVVAPEAPFPLKLGLSGVTTLSIYVEFGDGHSTCDYLDLADAKLIVGTSVK